MKARGLRQDDREPSFWESPLKEAAVRKSAGIRRRITPEAGRGLEKLGHAVEYLTDEFVLDGCRFAEDRGRLLAIGILASLNRQIYFSCVIEPTLRERVQRMFRRPKRQPSFRN